MPLAGIMILCVLGFQPTRPSVGVADFKMSQSATNHLTGKKYYSWSQDDTDALQRTFLVGLTKTQKFNVLNRDDIKRLYKELEYRKDNKPSSIQEFKKNNLSEASFLMEGTVSLFRLERKEEPAAYSTNGRVYVHFELQLVVDIALTEIERGSYAFTDQVNLNLQGEKGESVAQLVERAKKTVTEELLGKLMDELYPIMVIRGGTNDVLITVSKSPWFKLNQELDLYEQSDEPLIDPYTQEILGYDERLVGRVKIVQILPKHARAQIVKLNTTTVKPKTICRLPQGSD